MGNFFTNLHEDIKSLIACVGITITIIFGIIFTVKFTGDDCILENDCLFISTADIENTYEETGNYVEYMIADHNTEYIFGTVEEYVSAELNDGRRCVVSGIFYSKSTDHTVYEVAIIDIENKSDIEYILVDTKTCKMYNHEIHKPVIEDENMVEDLDRIENEYIQLQNEYMKNYEESKIITEEYMEVIVKEKLNYTNCRNLGIVENDNNVYYKIDVEYDNGGSDIVIVNARTGNIYK